jgi:hypothetical protein
MAKNVQQYIGLVLTSLAPYLIVSYGLSKIDDGHFISFWGAVGLLVGLRLFFGLIEWLGGMIQWRLLGKKVLIEWYLDYFRSHGFPECEHNDYNVLSYLGRIQDGGSPRYSVELQRAATMLSGQLALLEDMGIIIGMRHMAAANEALNNFLPKSNA